MAFNYIAVLEDSSNVAQTGVAQTASFNSKGYDPKNSDRIGLILDVGTVSGTSPTLDVKVQMSLDGGTTWLDTYPAAENSETQAALAQITASKETAEFWVNWLGLPGPGSASTIDPQVRFVFTIGGTNPSFTITNAYVVLQQDRAAR